MRKVLAILATLAISLLALPAVFVIYHSYRLYLERLENERCYAEQMADLHLRTIEALALAIEAKDLTTHDHLQRVQIYAMELGKVLQVAEDDLRRAVGALHAEFFSQLDAGVFERNGAVHA